MLSLSKQAFFPLEVTTSKSKLPGISSRLITYMELITSQLRGNNFHLYGGDCIKGLIQILSSACTCGCRKYFLKTERGTDMIVFPCLVFYWLFILLKILTEIEDCPAGVLIVCYTHDPPLLSASLPATPEIIHIQSFSSLAYLIYTSHAKVIPTVYIKTYIPRNMMNWEKKK